MIHTLYINAYLLFVVATATNACACVDVGIVL